MKIILLILGIVSVGVVILGVLFVRWANSPEQVEALQKKRQTDATKKVEDEKRKIELDQDFAAKRANLKLVIDENFANDQFESLDYKYDKISAFRFKNHEFTCSATIYRTQNPQRYFIFSKEDFEDFAAEMDLGIWGGDAFTGIFWDAETNGEQNPTAYQAAYSSPNTLFVKTKETENFGLGGYIESENNQKLRIERFGKNLRVSVNGRILFDKTIESAGKGKVGICLGDLGIARENDETMSIGIKSFKAWK